VTIDDLDSQTQQLLGILAAQQHKITSLETEIAALDTEAHLLAHVNAAFDQLIDLTTKESMGSVEQLVTYGLQHVFTDLGLRFRLQIDTKRGTQCVEPRLIDGTVDAPILDAFGGGPAAVVSFLLRLLVCRRLGLAPVLLLDEPFSFLSAQYVTPLAKLLRELADAAGVTLVLVTHDDRYLAHATRAYRAVSTPRGNTFQAVAP
jgi:DNA repair exonuclease SbcCD ATPase subunit